MEILTGDDVETAALGMPLEDGEIEFSYATIDYQVVAFADNEFALRPSIRVVLARTDQVNPAYIHSVLLNLVLADRQSIIRAK